MRTSVIRRFAQAAVLAAGMVALLYSTAAWAQERTIRVVVPFPAGGPTDMLARVLGEQIGRAQSATIVIENRPGAEGVIGTEAVSRAMRDGNTLLITPSNFVVNAHLRSTNYNPLTSFEPICHLVNSPEVLVVNSGSPYRTLADFIAAARAKPGDLTLAGGGATSRVIFEMLKRATGVNITYIPYPAGAPALTALLGGHVTSQLADYAPLAEQLKNGALRALATPSAMRIAQLPEVPTVAESGYTDIKVDSWYGLRPCRSCCLGDNGDRWYRPVPMRKGINPFTKQPTIFKSRPARKIIRARPVKAAKAAVS